MLRFTPAYRKYTRSSQMIGQPSGANFTVSRAIASCSDMPGYWTHHLRGGLPSP
ncbi:hypothetical protein PENANT_c017G11644 [Penicillium antarcticum]|uniref:Uncharacterized protein n=1 Tax=Penicillium antarcticum TaxID=416450 RepID=A0A1V6Q2D1_9EURO|nr:hypothetical protein PENANT_c017G11644 [Penicillium antarcticum]